MLDEWVNEPTLLYGPCLIDKPHRPVAQSRQLEIIFDPLFILIDCPWLAKLCLLLKCYSNLSLLSFIFHATASILALSASSFVVAFWSLVWTWVSFWFMKLPVWCFSTGENFAHQVRLGNVTRPILLSHLGICYWHLVGRGYGCCRTPHNAQDSAPKWGITWPKCQQCRCWKTLF